MRAEKAKNWNWNGNVHNDVRALSLGFSNLASFNIHSQLQTVQVNTMSIFNFRFVDNSPNDTHRGAYRKENMLLLLFGGRSHSDIEFHSILAETIFRSLLLNSLAYFLFNFFRFCFRSCRRPYDDGHLVACCLKFVLVFGKHHYAICRWTDRCC